MRKILLQSLLKKPLTEFSREQRLLLFQRLYDLPEAVEPDQAFA